MGWDIVFFAEFPTPEPAVLRFRRVWEGLQKRPHPSLLTSIKILRGGDNFDTLVELGAAQGTAGPTTPERVVSLLDQFASTSVSVRATWKIAGRRGNLDTVGGVTITTRSLEHRKDSRFGRNIDVTWDIGDSRRTSPEGHDGRPNVQQVITDASLLVDLGAKSIWGIDANRRIEPEYMYAVFHKHADDYHSDGFAHPVFPAQPIDEDLVLLATGGLSYIQVLQTAQGPIVYTRDLKNDRLNVFYAGMGGMLLALHEEESM